MTSLLFDLSFYAAAPFWLLMIAVPLWPWTRRVVASPWVVAPVVVVWLVLAAPVFGDLVSLVLQPTLEGAVAFVRDERGLAALWAQIIAWDLFIGRWVYLDSRERDIHPLVMAPVLVLMILLSPIGLPLYLVLRKGVTRRSA
ncbi:ABA4-like family protein [Actinokineospora pegani]|uniref:ABA4-like family protein n=1 Tax=Actinokineospora pegani TaxID=2654637 RepID=UPI0012EAF620|nr:ABA4-like family protein [Actinokineospora pegani]